MLWGLNSVSVQPTAAAAVSWLRGQIHSGLLLPGERLPSERKLADDIGISRVTLREALKRLEADRYVTIRRGAHGGAFVVEAESLQTLARRRLAVDPGAALRAQECRAMIEPGLARLASTRRDVPDLKHLSQAVELLSTARSPAERRQAQTMFRIAMAEATHNAHLLRSLRECLFDPLIPYPGPDATLPTFESFAAVAMAIRDRDDAEAERQMTRIVQQDWADLRALLRA